MRVEGRVNGDNYELTQNGVVKQAIPLAQVDDRLRAAIKRNKWQAIP